MTTDILGEYQEADSCSCLKESTQKVYPLNRQSCGQCSGGAVTGHYTRLIRTGSFIKLSKPGEFHILRNKLDEKDRKGANPSK